MLNRGPRSGLPVNWINEEAAQKLVQQHNASLRQPQQAQQGHHAAGTATAQVRHRLLMHALRCIFDEVLLGAFVMLSF